MTEKKKNTVLIPATTIEWCSDCPDCYDMVITEHFVGYACQEKVLPDNMISGLRIPDDCPRLLALKGEPTV